MVNLLRGKEFFYFTGYRSCGEINYVINPLVENVINLPCSQKIFHSLIFCYEENKTDNFYTDVSELSDKILSVGELDRDWLKLSSSTSSKG